MRNIISFLLVLCFVFLSGHISAQDDQQAMMEAWQKYMTPGPMHELLAKRVGEWKSEMKMWMDPSQPPTTSEGSAVCEALLGGRYFQTKHESTFMGMPFTGEEVTGFDNAKKKFFSTWIDNMGTGIMLLEGPYDEATKTITLTGNVTDAMGKEVPIREVIKHIDDDNTFFEMYNTVNGKEFKSMEIKLSRKKG